MTNLNFMINGVRIGLAEVALIFLFLFVIFLVIRNLTMDKIDQS